MHGVIELVDDDLMSVIVNWATADYFDRSPAELSGRRFSELGVPAADIQMLRQRCQVLGGVGGEDRFEHEIEVPGLGRRHLRVTLRLLGRGANARQFVCNAEDTTESTAAFHRLRRTEQSFAALVKNLAGAVYRCQPNADATVEFISDACTAITGYTSDELIGNRLAALRSLVHRDDAPTMRERLKLTLVERREYSDEYRIVHRDGTVRWVLDRAQGAYDEAGNLLHVEGLLVDVTERRHAAIERRELQEQLLHAQRVDSIGRLVGGVAHDFNNLLAVVLGHADMLGEELGPTSPLSEHVSEIRGAADRSVHLARQLLGYARRQQMAPTILNLNETVSAAISMLRRLIGETIDIRWVPDADAWPVLIDPTQLDQILTNLCLNSRDAMSGTGALTISTRNEVLGAEYVATHRGAVAGEYVELFVGDAGSGMGAETLERIFEPFFTTKSAGMGTGLGMATVYGIIKQNRGYIDIRSQPGKGTEVRVYFPRHVDPVEPTPDGLDSPDLPRGAERILLVEDDPALLRTERRILESLGYSVIATQSPNDAAVLAARYAGRINLLVTDVIMPGLNGPVLADHLQSQVPSLKVVFMSGYDGVGTILPADAVFVAKPFTTRQLAVAVRNVLDA